MSTPPPHVLKLSGGGISTTTTLHLCPSTTLVPDKKKRKKKKKKEEKNSSSLYSPLFFPLLFLSSSSSHVREDHRGVGRLPSVKGFNKTMSSSLGESNRCMMVRSSPKLFWNGVLDRIIRFLVQSSARAFRISLFGRPLLNSYQKADYSIRDSIP